MATARQATKFSTNEQTNELTNEQTNKKTNEQMNEQTRFAEFGVCGLVRQRHREYVDKPPWSVGFAGGKRIDVEGEGQERIKGNEAEGVRVQRRLSSTARCST